MFSTGGQVILADGDAKLLKQYSSVLSRPLVVPGHPGSEAPRVLLASTGPEVVQLVRVSPIDIVLAEETMTPMSGLEVLEAVKRASPSTLVILTTRRPTVESAISAFRSGAFDYLVHPLSEDQLLLSVGKGLELRRLGEQRRRAIQELQDERAKVIELRNLVRDRLAFGHALGASPSMLPVYKILEEVSRADSTVLITGESGTGKGVVARMIHAHSPRSEEPFVEANCVIYSEGVLQSELFGHERGAFTGASRQKRGRFELAHGGTIFLDEIGEIGPAIQLMLLRFLQERRFERVGGEETIEVDVRVVAATNRDLDKAMSASLFRQDLFYRLNVIPICLPPLRERREDVPFLAQRILERCRLQLGRECEGIAEDAMEALLEYDWPGNIRELENVIERTLVLAPEDRIRREDLPEALRGGGRARSDGHLKAREREHILEALRRCGGNKKAAARSLGIHRSSLYSKLHKLGIVPVRSN